MLKAIYPGSFDPITNGHLDIIERSSKLVDKLVVSILENPNKDYLFTVEERKEHLKLVTSHLPNVEISSFYGLMVDFAKSINANLVIRGLRAVTDFEIEFQRALINRKLAPEVETIFISASEKNMFLSSSAVKEVAVFGGNLNCMVPPEIIKFVEEKYRK
ncbi:MAG: pantetheine-phosphate adenylyltransferase [Lachnospiraceae bacterium]|nr:pantetheine-phosphate adenylyltransferase [Lachnospiraceae bacterium]